MQTRHPTFLRTSTLLFISLLSGAPLSGRVVDDWQYRHPLPHNQSLWKVAYGAGQYVMTGNGGVITTSPDLQRWQSTFRSELDRLDGLLYANGGFLASSRTGTILMSPDGKSWTEQVSGTEKGLLSAAYGNGRYVLTGEDGTTATSTDGQNWTISDTGDDNWYFGVTYGNGLFVAASFDWEGFNTGSFAVSSDGVNWTLVNLPAGWPEYVELYDVGYGGGKFVATGYFYEAIDINTDNWGVFIATSTDGTTWTRATNGVPEVINNPSAPTARC